MFGATVTIMMNPMENSKTQADASRAARKKGFGVIVSLLPYIWMFKWRVMAALACLVIAKVASVMLPVYLKDIVDQLSLPGTALMLPAAALLAYGFARISSSIFSELRDALFSKVTQGSIQRIATTIFTHLFGLSIRYHLERQTGGLSRDMDRGTKGIGFLLNFTLFNILPTLLELTMVMVILLVRYDIWFAVVILATIAAYIVFTLVVTERRMVMRRRMNSLDSMANTQAIDALINYETVKYFNNESYEIHRYDSNLGSWVDSAVKNQISLNLLNAGQGVIITLGMVVLLWMAAGRVTTGQMTVGDIVLISAYLTQLYAPLNFLGFIYREIKNSLSDMERMFGILDQHQEIEDTPQSVPLDTRDAEIRFDHVGFAYEPERQILHDVNFTIAAGETVAVVGTSGAGKSTLARLLFRFYDVTSGRITINGRDIREYTQLSLRQHIGIVPQDTVLFNNSIYYNIAYGRPDATREEVLEAARAASIHEFVMSLPEGYDTQVGERGLKLSGGEKQRVAIARTILKNPPILVLDEATSALDTRTERAIQDELYKITKGRSTMIIAHRLSTIVEADRVLVMDQGRVVEQGSHVRLLQANGVYARMWAMQFAATDEGTDV